MLMRQAVSYLNVPECEEGGRFWGNTAGSIGQLGSPKVDVADQDSIWPRIQCIHTEVPANAIAEHCAQLERLQAQQAQWPAAGCSVII